KALALALLLAQTFCPALQQSSALAQEAGAPASSASEDSDAFLRSATRSRPARDYTQRVEALLRQMTLEEKVGQMTQLQIGMAATWDPELMRRLGEVTGLETRAAGIPWTFSPVLDIGRQPLWPRFYETFGEDPYLAKVMGAAFVRGVEGEDISAPDSVAVSLKHYMGYSLPLSGRDRTSAWIPENYLREYFLPTFAEAVKAGAHTVMVNSAEINGTPGHINRHILTDILRGELGFRGFVVSDWE